MARRSARSSDNGRVVRLPLRGRPRAAGRIPVGIQAVDAGLEILDRIVSSGAGLSLSTLSRETGLKPNLLHRYLVSLTRRGLLAQASLTGLYDLGPYARQVGLAALNRFDEMAHVHQFVTTLVAQTGHTVAVYVWSDLGPTLIRLETGTHSFPVALRTGSALPLCTSATGRVFLAYMPDALTRSFLERERAIAAIEGQPMPTLKEELSQIRRDRFYVTKEAIIPSLAVVGPIMDANGRLFCTLTGLAPRGTNANEREQLVVDIRHAVGTLTRNLFGNSHPQQVGTGEGAGPQE
jgi:DNA-binding IclR family transcriptional regulator